MYSIGLDIGIASVGWSVIDDQTGRIIDLGVSLFSAKNPENNLERREARGARRLKSRKKTRLSDAKKILASINFSEDPELRNQCPYSLRVKGLNEQLTKGEIYRVVLQLIKKRGISYLEEDSEEGAKESPTYKNEVLNNAELLKQFTPGEIQLQRLKQNGRIKTGINNQGNYQLNVFTVSAYAEELKRILLCQQAFYPEITPEIIDLFTRKGVGEEAGLIYRKRPYYHGPGNKANPSPYGRWADFAKNGKPAENIFDRLIGKDIQGELRASASSFSAQKFNLLNDLNNLRLPRENPHVTTEEKAAILQYLMEEDVTRFGANDLAKFLGYPTKEIKGWRVNKNDKPEIHSLKVYRDWRAIFNEYGIELNEVPVATIDTIAKILTLNTELDGINNTLELELPTLELDIKEVIQKEFKTLKKKASNSSWHSFSLKTLGQLIDLMEHQPKEQNTVLEELNLKPDLRDTYSAYTKIPIKEITEEIYNPTVNKAVTRAFHVMNELVKCYGKHNLSYVTIEMPRDKNEDDQKNTIKKIQKANEERKKESEKYFLEQSGWSESQFEYEMRKKGFAVKLGYYYEQGGRCAYSGKPISAELLTSAATEIDHVIPLSISLDDSMNNKVLVLSEANQEKGQRSPYQAYHDGANLGQTWNEYEQWVKSTYKKKHKRKILLDSRDIYNPEVREKFIARNLNDTRYASRVVLNTLQSFFNQNSTKVQVVTGSYTHTLRKKWGESLDKTRDTHHHHAVDATLCAVTPFVQISRFKYHADDEGNKYMIDQETGEKLAYQDYKTMKRDERRSYVPLWPDFIGQLLPTKLYPKIKFSHQVDRKNNRKISKATIYSTRQVEEVVQKSDKEVINEKTYIIDKTEDIYTPKGWKEFEKKKDKLLMKVHDPVTFQILCDIADNYPTYEDVLDTKGKVKRMERSPFERYCKENDVPAIRKYSKKGNGPYIRKLKYYKNALGNHINVTRNEAGESSEMTKHHKKAVLLFLNPWRTDVYYNQEKHEFELMGIKYNHLKFIKGEYGIPRITYEQIKQSEEVSPESEFCFSLYKKDRILVQEGEESIEVLHNSKITNTKNNLELKPIDKVNWEKNEIVPVFGGISDGRLRRQISSTMILTKVYTDHLGNCFYVKKEKLKNIL